MNCSNCNQELSQEKAIYLEDGTTVCYSCLEYLQHEQERNSMMQVTREMAIDGGDRSLEGTWIRW